MNDQYTRTMAIKILEWMACGYRTLKTYEILDGLAFRPGCTILNAKTKINKAVLDHCLPLIEEGPSSTLDFVHFSAKEYTTYPTHIVLCRAHFNRYILNGQYNSEKPFIHVQQAYFNITYSCVSYLNTCLPLFTANGTETERAIVVIQGFHSLHLYANEFWYKHLLAYARCCLDERVAFPMDLLDQLSSLLRFQKDKNIHLECQESPTSVSRLEVLDQVPAVRDLVSNLVAFKEALKKDDPNCRNAQGT
jgi:hypothetical protein